MSRKLTLFACFAVLVGVFLASCDTDGEQKRSIVTVSSMNNNAPFFSDVLEQGDTLYYPPGVPFTQDDFVKEDWCPIILKNTPYNTIVFTGPDRPYSDFLVTHYHVQWRRVDGGGPVPGPSDGATNINVPSGEEVEANILLIPYEVKNTALMMSINYLNPGPGPAPAPAFPDEFLMVADVTLYGHEVGTGREQEFTASVSVSFGDPVVKTEKN